MTVLDGLAAALDAYGTELAALARRVDEYGRLDAPDVATRMCAQVVAGDVGAAAALVAQAWRYAQQLETPDPTGDAVAAELDRDDL